MKPIHEPGRDERGIALVITLLLISMTTALGLVMYLSVSSDMFINGYYRNFRGAFYAADSGLNIARAQLVNQVLAQVPTTFAVPPLADPVYHREFNFDLSHDHLRKFQFLSRRARLPAPGGRASRSRG